MGEIGGAGWWRGRAAVGVVRDGALRFDHGLALATLASAVAFAVEGSGLDGARWPVAVVAALAALAAIASRHRRPLEALLVVGVAVVAAPAPGLLVGSALVVVYAVAASHGRRDASIAALSMAAAFVVERASWGLPDDTLPPVLVAIAAAAAVGLYAGVRRAIAVERAQFERRQETLVAERVAAEGRVRIARELHDVVAHTLSLIVVQSEVLSTRVDDEELRAGAAAVAELGRVAMGELHRTLELLRGEDESAERAPQPALVDLEQLVEQTRRSGLAVDLAVEGELRPLPASVELCAYRIVQEALTNVRKHAGAARADVRLRYGLEALDVSIEDDGVGAAAGAEADGHGLRGMRERAAMLGGALSVGPLDGDGYRVSAILPYSSERR